MSNRILKLVGLVALMLIVSQLLFTFISNSFSLQTGLLSNSLEYLSNLLFAGLGILLGLKLIDSSIAHSIQSIIDNPSSKYSCDDNIAPLCETYRDQASQLEQRNQDLRTTSNQLATSAAQISETTERTQSNTTRQQAEIDMVATAMNEMTATVEEVARNAELAAVSAKTANDEAGSGMQVANQSKTEINSLVQDIDNAAQVLNKLAAESDNIGSVLDVIKGIADQTNLLALNAAIEAARAGEQGRGFAVVADEVRTLASRTQQSTLEIQEMIGKLQSGTKDSVTVMSNALERGQSSVEAVDKTVSSLHTIQSAISSINDMNAQIATASEEQTQVANEINQNLVNISSISQQTTADADDAYHASVALSDISMQLSEKTKTLGGNSNGLDLSAAKAAHLNWKTRLRDFLDGKASLSMEEAVSHHDCKFGKWYFSEGLEKYSHPRHYCG
ncbi:MAG: hypothetical protein GXP11_11155 [Gammaproteobacteria bacterium]|nr:hypothetical protein [Gammaproteobacteria bacterium]